MSLLVALVLFAQATNPVAIRGYVLGSADDPRAVVLVLPTGRYSLQLGAGCDQVQPGQNVDVVAGSRGLAAITPVGTDDLCQALMDAVLSEEPCVTNADGVCDVAAEAQP